MDTAAKMETACANLSFIPIPLTDGGAYGPVTIPGGPYGSKMEWNQGKGTEFVNPVNGSESICIPTGVDTFAEPASVNAQIENLRSMDHSLYTIFRPACMKDGETYPVITWANGTCGETAGYAPLLSTVASYGFVIFASNSTWTATAPTDKVQLRALDYAKYVNEDPTQRPLQEAQYGQDWCHGAFARRAGDRKCVERPTHQGAHLLQRRHLEQRTFRVHLRRQGHRRHHDAGILGRTPTPRRSRAPGSTTTRSSRPAAPRPGTWCSWSSRTAWSA